MMQHDAKTLFPKKPLMPTTMKLKPYSRKVIVPAGVMKCKVNMNKQTQILDMYVVEKGSKPLFGDLIVGHKPPRTKTPQ
ncbi:hypothetical protein DPMN_064247 [Dreissena polymorpha]|uniref:Uncharacterized protein n=1 Tax=Dreissena polymorpha TaxID=45954 RepID=A0A9D4HLY7_DREPO|nr:hypothetical protein DPMN_064247 [Dreissena polymorpha]